MRRSLRDVRRGMLVTLAALVPLLASCGGTPAAPLAQTSAAAPPETAGVALTGVTATASTPAPIPPGAAVVSPAGNVLRLHWSAEPEHLDPQKSVGFAEVRVAVLTYLPLMTYDSALKVVPGSAERVTIAPDGRTYTFALRSNQTYADGTRLTAANFAYAFKRLCDPETAAPYASIVYPIVGCQAYAEALTTGGLSVTNRAELSALRDRVGVTALDDTTLEVKVDQAGPWFLNTFALWVGAPVRQDLVEAGGEDWWTDPANTIGNGPFKLTTWDHGNSMRFERNETFVLPDRRPTLDAIEGVIVADSSVAFQAYRAGELDVIDLAPEDLAVVENDPALRAQHVAVGGACTYYLSLDPMRAPFGDKLVRQAFAQAVDREAWVRDVQEGLGQPALSLIPPGMPGHDQNERRWSLDPASARQKLEQAGFDMAQEITLTYAAEGRNRTTMEYLAAMLQTNLGVKIVLDPLEPATSRATRPQLTIGGWCADYADPQNWLSVVFAHGGVYHGLTGWSHERFDALTHEADALQLDDPRRAELYDEAQRLLVEEAPVAFLFYPYAPYLVQPWVTGVHHTALDPVPGMYDLGSIRIVTGN